MRPLRFVALAGLALAYACSLLALPAADAPKPTLDQGSIDAYHPRIIGITVSYDREDENAILKEFEDFRNAVAKTSSWRILIDGQPGSAGVQEVDVVSESLIRLELTEGVSAAAALSGKVSVWFAGSSSPEIKSKTITIKEADPKKHKNRTFPPQFNFTSDKKNPNLDVAGSFQSGVGAKPQYQWSVLVKAPFEHNGCHVVVTPVEHYVCNWVLSAGPKFNGVASQETNADPDSLSASFPVEFDFPFTKVGSKSLPINLSFNPIDYEFERKAKQEAVLVNGKPTVHNYQQKNTNYIASGQVQFVVGWSPVNVNINLGTEFGSALSRSVLNQTPKSGYSDNPLRAVDGADVYFKLPKAGKYPFLAVDGHYTVRSLFHPEPFKQAGVNNGNEFYTTKARHYINVNLARTIAKGSNFTVKYLYGSLPPTYSFVDHQVTIGFEVILGK